MVFCYCYEKRKAVSDSIANLSGCSIISRGIVQLIDLTKAIKKELSTEKHEVIITGFNTDSIAFGYACGKD